MFGFSFIFGVLISLICIARGSEELLPTDPDVFEGGCRQIEPALNFTSLLPLLSAPNVYGVYLASASSLRVYAATFLGRPAQNQDEINNMCLSILFASLVAQQRGFGDRTFINIATPRGLRHLGTFDLSTHVAHSPEVDTTFQRSARGTVVWSDGRNHVIFVRCVNNQFMDWKLLSKIPPTDEEKDVVLNVIESLGFKREFAVDLTKSGKTCPPLQTVQEFTSQSLRDFRTSSSSISSGNSDTSLRRALVTPIVQSQRIYSSLHGFLTSIFKLGPNLS